MLKTKRFVPCLCKHVTWKYLSVTQKNVELSQLRRLLRQQRKLSVCFNQTKKIRSTLELFRSTIKNVCSMLLFVLQVHHRSKEKARDSLRCLKHLTRRLQPQQRSNREQHPEKVQDSSFLRHQLLQRKKEHLVNKGRVCFVSFPSIVVK